MDDNKLIDAEKSFEIKALKKKIEDLVTENNKLKFLLKELDPDADISEVSDQEIICIEQIKKLKEYSAKRDLTMDETKQLDILIKNLRLIQGDQSRSATGKSAKTASKEELEKIIKGK